MLGQLPSGGARAVTGPAEMPHRRHIYNQFVIRTRERESLRAHLGAAQIGTEIYYPTPLHLMDVFDYLGHYLGDFPESERAANESLALPIYPELTEDMQRRVVESIGDWQKSA